MIYLISFGCIYLIFQYQPITLCLIPFLFIHGFNTVRTICLRTSKTAIVHCQHLWGDRWRLRNRAGKSFLVKSLDKAYRSPWLIIMTFQTLPSQRPLNVVIAYDALTSKMYTHLLARLWHQ